MSKDTSMDQLAAASVGANTQYVTSDGITVEVRKARTTDYPIVLKVIRSVASYIDRKVDGAMSDGDAEAAMEKATTAFSDMDQLFALIEDNMPLVIEVIGRLTDLGKEGVSELPLEDLIGLGVVVWQVNQRFFMQAMALASGLMKSTPQAPSKNPAGRKRVRKT